MISVHMIQQLYGKLPTVFIKKLEPLIAGLYRILKTLSKVDNFYIIIIQPILKDPIIHSTKR